MIVPDVNLLLYAYDATSLFHEKASRWWAGCLSGSEAVGLPLIVVFGYLRICTNPRVFRNPLAVADAAEDIRSWLAHPVVEILQPAVDSVERVLEFVESVGVAGNLVTDAQLAALVMEHGAVLHTTDADFVRFKGLRWFNPLTGASNPKL